MTLKIPPSPLTDEQDAERQQQIAAEEQSREKARRLNAVEEIFRTRPRYRYCSLASFQVQGDKYREQQAAVDAVKDYLGNMQNRITAGSGIVFIGPPGTGKDHLMSVLIQAAVLAGHDVEWVDGMALFGESRDRISEERSESSFVSRFVSARVLAISDPLPPFGDLTSFQASTLFRIVDGRYQRRHPTWITINGENGAEVSKRMGPQTVDRLRDGAMVVSCGWSSWRRPNTSVQSSGGA